MKKETKRKISSMLFATILCVGNVVPVLATDVVDSIGSINANDDGTTIGVDQSQSQKTEYTTEITEESKKDTLVYVSQASTFSVKIPKVIILDGQTKSANYLVSVAGNIGGEETINVVPEETFTMSQTGKEDIVANVIQDKTSWLFNEFATQGNGTITANDMTAGSWKGQFDFNIELKSDSCEHYFLDESCIYCNAPEYTNTYTTLTANNAEASVNYYSKVYDGVGLYTFDVTHFEYNGNRYKIEGVATYDSFTSLWNGYTFTIDTITPSGDNVVLTYTDDVGTTHNVTVKILLQTPNY